MPAGKGPCWKSTSQIPQALAARTLLHRKNYRSVCTLFEVELSYCSLTVPVLKWNKLKNKTKKRKEWEKERVRELISSYPTETKHTQPVAHIHYGRLIQTQKNYLVQDLKVSTEHLSRALCFCRAGVWVLPCRLRYISVTRQGWMDPQLMPRSSFLSRRLGLRDAVTSQTRTLLLWSPSLPALQMSVEITI